MSTASILILFIVLWQLISMVVNSTTTSFRLLGGYKYIVNNNVSMFTYAIEHSIKTLIIVTGLLSAFTMTYQYQYLSTIKIMILVYICLSMFILFLINLISSNSIVTYINDMKKGSEDISPVLYIKFRKFVNINLFLSFFINSTIYIVITDILKTLK